MTIAVRLLLLFALCLMIFYADNPSLNFSCGFNGESQNPQSQRNLVTVTVLFWQKLKNLENEESF